MGRKTFDYEALPFGEIEKLYLSGWGWKAIAAHYGAPDHKTLLQHVARHLPNLEMRDHAQAQRARRSREGTTRPRARRVWADGGEA
jgi:hypothetical protein